MLYSSPIKWTAFSKGGYHFSLLDSFVYWSMGVYVLRGFARRICHSIKKIVGVCCYCYVCWVCQIIKQQWEKRGSTVRRRPWHLQKKMTLLQKDQSGLFWVGKIRTKWRMKWEMLIHQCLGTKRRFWLLARDASTTGTSKYLTWWLQSCGLDFLYGTNWAQCFPYVIGTGIWCWIWSRFCLILRRITRLNQKKPKAPPLMSLLSLKAVLPVYFLRYLLFITIKFSVRS